MIACASRNAEQARPRIARLRPRRHAAQFEEAEAERGERVDVLGVLVEAGGEADRIREISPIARTGQAGGFAANSPARPENLSAR